MICVRCNSENPDFFRFCRRCGVPLGQACFTCGFENPPESKFCGNCGVRLQDVRADALGERRQLTVLFCDLVGSTQLARELDPEDLGRLMAEYQRICGEAVVKHEGYIAQYLGDGVVVYFGYPRSHEDEAQRAVRCGLDILEGVEMLRESGEIPGGSPIGIRLGAHTGRVVVGVVGAGDRKSPLAIGDTPNLAARIQSEAEPGTFTVSETTWRIVEGYFRGKSLGECRLKGIAEPIKLWRILGENPSRERVEVAPLVPFVGRATERSLLRDVWEHSRSSGRSHFAVVRGDPGIGKSRLTQLFREEVQFDAADVIGLRATAYNIASPFHPLIEVIQQRFSLDPALPADELLNRLEEGLARLGLSGTEPAVLFAALLYLPTGRRYPTLDLSPARRRTRTLEISVEFVAALAQKGPALLVVEDLHWADSSTLDFLELLVSSPPPVPLCGVFTTRPEVDAAWMSAPTVQLLDLPRFQWTEAEAIARGVAFGKGLPADVLRRIIDRSDGVPLFVEALTGSVLESGLLTERAASWEAVGPLSADMIPASVDASLMSHVDQLGASRVTAQLAATIGREFSLDLLRVVSERTEETLAADIQCMLQRGIARPVEEDGESFVFKHALVRDAAYNSLLRQARQEFHSRIAAALRGPFAARTAGRPDLIAYHLTNAGEDEEAVTFWEAAGHQALGRSAFHAAADHFQRAVDSLRRLDATPDRQGRELELRILLAPLLMTVYGWGSVEAEHACERALDLAQALDRPDRMYAPLWGIWTVQFLRGQLRHALQSAEKVLALAQQSGMPLLEVTARHATAFTHIWRGEVRRALEEADLGLALYDFEQERQLTDLFQFSSSVCLLATRGHALWMLGRLEEAEEEWERMRQLAAELEHLPSLAAAMAFTLHADSLRYSYVGEIGKLRSLADELVVLSREEDFYAWYTGGRIFQGVIAQASGEEERGPEIESHVELFIQSGTQLTLVMMYILWAEALERLGRDDEALARLDAAERETTREEGLLAPDIWRIRGRVLARRGKVAQAEAAYLRAIEQARAQEALSLELRAALDLYGLLAGEGRGEEGRARLATLIDSFPEGLDRPEPARARAIVRGGS